MPASAPEKIQPAAHTPGPWYFHRGVILPCGNTYVENGETYSRRAGGEAIAELIRNPANGRLIAAAPALLEALLGVVRVADRATDEFDAARAAIAQAVQS